MDICFITDIFHITSKKDIVYKINVSDLTHLTTGNSNVCFCTGELGKLEVVHEGILHRCIQQLLEKKRTLSVADQAEDLECLCQIMKTVGKRLDTDKARVCIKYSNCTLFLSDI